MGAAQDLDARDAAAAAGAGQQALHDDRLQGVGQLHADLRLALGRVRVDDALDGRRRGAGCAGTTGPGAPSRRRSARGRWSRDCASRRRAARPGPRAARRAGRWRSRARRAPPRAGAPASSRTARARTRWGPRASSGRSSGAAAPAARAPRASSTCPRPWRRRPAPGRAESDARSSSGHRQCSDASAARSRATGARPRRGPRGCGRRAAARARRPATSRLGVDRQAAARRSWRGGRRQREGLEQVHRACRQGGARAVDADTGELPSVRCRSLAFIDAARAMRDAAPRSSARTASGAPSGRAPRTPARAGARPEAAGATDGTPAGAVPAGTGAGPGPARPAGRDRAPPLARLKEHGVEAPRPARREPHLERADARRLVREVDAAVGLDRLLALAVEDVAEQLAQRVLRHAGDRQLLGSPEGEHLRLAVGSQPEFVGFLTDDDGEQAIDTSHNSMLARVRRESSCAARIILSSIRDARPSPRGRRPPACRPAARSRRPRSGRYRGWPPGAPPRGRRGRSRPRG